MIRFSEPGIRMLFAAAALAALLAAPPRARGCACGCDVFEVGTGSMFPIEPGDRIDFEYDYQNQDRNWSGSSSSPAQNNDDKNIRTRFYTFGVRRMFNRGWGVSVRIPYWDRHFVTGDDGAIAAFNHGAAGDISIRGMYTGFSPDMSTGLTFGLKLPSGDHSYPHFDPDTEIGSGSTDLMAGMHHLGRLPGGSWTWFASVLGQQPLWHLKDYRPGGVVDGTAGVYHHGWTLGAFRLLPLGQLIAAVRGRDVGSGAAPGDTGFERVLLAPGADLHWRNLHVFGNVGFRVWQHVHGNQLVASSVVKLDLGIDL
jgi:hypothetical protein